MKYHVRCNKRVVYTEKAIKHFVKVNGHMVCKDPQEADAILVSMCDITEIFDLEKTREEYPNKVIIAGGHLSVSCFVLMGMFADFVNIGHIFEFLKCKSIEQIKNQDFIYYKGKKNKVRTSQYINWDMAPMVRTSKKRVYYWAGVGCRNKCRFCLTSWTNRAQTNSEKNINAVERKSPYSVKFICNETQHDPKKSTVQDMLMIDVAKGVKLNSKLIRVGVEFATEETRKRYGKSITTKQIKAGIIQANRQGKDLQIFYITGINTYEEWMEHINKIYCYMQKDLRPKIYLKFTNLGYQQGTPLFKERYDINIDNYFGGEFTKTIYDKVRMTNQCVRTFMLKYPAHALWRTGASLAITENQYEVYKKLKNSKDLDLMYRTLYESNVIHTDYEEMGLIDYKDIHRGKLKVNEKLIKQ